MSNENTQSTPNSMQEALDECRASTISPTPSDYQASTGQTTPTAGMLIREHFLPLVRAADDAADAAADLITTLRDSKTDLDRLAERQKELNSSAERIFGGSRSPKT